jgi:hypothetical protein
MALVQDDLDEWTWSSRLGPGDEDIPRVGKNCWLSRKLRLEATLALTVCLISLGLCDCRTSPRATLKSDSLELTFTVDSEYDKETLLAMFRQDDPAGHDQRAADMGIDAETALRLRNDGLVEARKEVAGIVDGIFARAGEKIAESVEDFESQWKELLPVFSAVVAETTGARWARPKYTCVVSSCHIGLSNWYGDKVAARYSAAPEEKRRIVANEIALSDVFQLMRRRHSPAELSDWQLWAFSEVTTVFILDDSRLRPFWLDISRGSGYFLHSNYPQLAGIESRLKELFDRRTSYGNYEDESVDILRAFQAFAGSDRSAAERAPAGWVGLYLRQDEGTGKEGADSTTARRVIVLDVFEGSPAKAAGIRAGDSILAVGDTNIEGAQQLTDLIRSMPRGYTTTISLLRSGERIVVPITVGWRN